MSSYNRFSLKKAVKFLSGSDVEDDDVKCLDLEDENEMIDEGNSWMQSDTEVDNNLDSDSDIEINNRYINDSSSNCSSDEIETDSDEVRYSNFIHIVKSPNNIEWTSSNFFFYLYNFCKFKKSFFQNKCVVYYNLIK